jgi:hypothetical protein
MPPGRTGVRIGSLSCNLTCHPAILRHSGARIIFKPEAFVLRLRVNLGGRLDDGNVVWGGVDSVEQSPTTPQPCARNLFSPLQQHTKITSRIPWVFGTWWGVLPSQQCAWFAGSLLRRGGSCPIQQPFAAQPHDAPLNP